MRRSGAGCTVRAQPSADAALLNKFARRCPATARWRASTSPHLRVAGDRLQVTATSGRPVHRTDLLVEAPNGSASANLKVEMQDGGFRRRPRPADLSHDAAHLILDRRTHADPHRRPARQSAPAPTKFVAQARRSSPNSPRYRACSSPFSALPSLAVSIFKFFMPRVLLPVLILKLTGVL